jgi:hypothetical protein
MKATRIGWALLLAIPVLCAAQSVDKVLLGADRKPLPFTTADEILEFIATAREVSSEPLSEGITRARRLRLSKNGVELHVVFHHVNESEQRVKRLPNGNVVMYVRDSYTSQVAAFEVSRLLGMTDVPPTITRISDGEAGSAQLWIEQATTEKVRQEDGLEPPNYVLWNQVYADMRVFDNLINNIDRNQGNMLVDSQWNLWLIDHTRSFGRDKTLPMPETVTRCSSRLWQALQELDETELRHRLSPLLVSVEIEALLVRHEKLVELIQQRIEDKGLETVLFDFGDPESGIKVEYTGAGKP